jgi:YidC/Oxa1 family membrane protein insertase
VAEVWGGILRFFGVLLAGIYSFIPSYGVAIILLTLITRLVIAPLGVKQIRSMQQMQKLQPKIKELQKKYKGDRQKLNEEMMKLYKEHGANPLGGCFPLIAQFPVFIALYAVIRATIPAVAVPATELDIKKIPATAFCHPNTQPNLDNLNPTKVVCDLADGTAQTYDIAEWRPTHPNGTVKPLSALSSCTPVKDTAGKGGFTCHTIFGAGHLPKDSKLLEDLVEGRTKFLGMHLACSPRDAGNATGVKKCAPKGEKAGGADVAGYYVLVIAMAGSTYVQQRQMSSRATGQQAQQMKMMAVMMPALFGWLSLTFPAALSLYWVAGNIWTIVQQKVIFGKEEPSGASAPAPDASKPKQNPKPKPGQGKKGKS